MKVLSLFFLNNATAACIVSTAAAIFAGIAFGVGWLPAVSQHRCWWCMGIGSIIYVLTMMYLGGQYVELLGCLVSGCLH